MSADNGIYILKTKDQYRVIHAQAIDNLWYSHFTKSNVSEEMVPTRIVDYFGDCKYTRNQKLARKIASNMANHTSILEYGIIEFEINKTWSQIIKEAKEVAQKEIDVINQKNDSRWNYDIKNLKKILAM